MHDCRKTRRQITELVLEGADRRPDDVLLAGLRGCAECRAEFDAINETLRITTLLRDTVAPAESYWTGYHARLRQKLESTIPHNMIVTREPSWLVRFFKSSLRVPVPVAVASILVCAVLVPVGLRVARQQSTQSPSIVRVPVEVPVIQEKIVTRVVYRDRRSPQRNSKRAVDGSRIDSTFAKSQKPRNVSFPASLVGFKPSDEVKLTVIKGGSPNEK